MEEHHAEQRNTLIQINTGKEKLDSNSKPDCHGRSRCLVALTALMGLVILGLVVFNVLCGAKTMPDCKVCDAPVKLQRFTINKPEKDKHLPGVYDIFTSNKAGDYFISGWVKLPNSVSKQSVKLLHIWNGENTPLKDPACSCTNVYFFDEVKLVNNSRLSLVFADDKSSYEECTFNVYEL